MHQISKLLAGRTENQVRNRYATLIRHGIADSYKLIDDKTMSSGLHVDAYKDHTAATWSVSNYDTMSSSANTMSAKFSSRIPNNDWPAVNSYSTSSNGLLLGDSNIHRVDHNYECNEPQFYENATNSNSTNPNYYVYEDTNNSSVVNTSSSYFNDGSDCYQGDAYECKGQLNQISRFSCQSYCDDKNTAYPRNEI